jgi:hypothetical protein
MAVTSLLAGWWRRGGPLRDALIGPAMSLVRDLFAACAVWGNRRGNDQFPERKNSLSDQELRPPFRVPSATPGNTHPAPPHRKVRGALWLGPGTSICAIGAGQIVSRIWVACTSKRHHLEGCFEIRLKAARATSRYVRTDRVMLLYAIVIQTTEFHHAHRSRCCIECSRQRQ